MKFEYFALQAEKYVYIYIYTYNSKYKIRQKNIENE